MAGLGEELRATREARNLSLSDVSERLHIRTVYLQSLEEEDWAAIAAPVYVRGFLRTYARFLGLDPEAAVARFNEAVPPQVASVPQQGRYLRTSARRGPSPWLWLASAAAIVLLGFVGYNYYELQKEQPIGVVGMTSEQPVASPTPSTGIGRAAAAGRPGATASPSRGPAGRAAGKGLGVKLVQRSWLRIAVDGSTPMEGIYPAGTERVFHGKTVTVRAGNAAGVDVTVNGRDVGTLGAPGDVVERTFTLAQE
jgi:cytoskeleton protein RodZ